MIGVVVGALLVANIWAATQTMVDTPTVAGAVTVLNLVALVCCAIAIGLTDK